MNLRKSKIVRLGTIIFTLSIALSFFAFKPATSSRYFEIAKNLEILTSVYSEVNRYYVDEVDPSKIMKEGIDAMLNSLDPYTTYIPEDKIEDFRFISTGEYGGIGAVIGNRDGKIMVIMPYEGFPAHKAGLLIGDEIVDIAGQKVSGKNSDAISALLKGQAGTPVDVKVNRYGQDSLLVFSLMREKITVRNVPYYGMVTGDIGYFKLQNFTTDAAKEIRNAIKELQKKGAKKYVFDLRGNTGGLLKEAIEISNLFVDKGVEIVSTKGKSKRWNNVYYANNVPLDKESPLVVLVNGRSASASEIVSGVIQDYDRGVLIGDRTFGKGLVQATMPTVFNSQVKVTTAKYYIPSGRCIQAIDYSSKDKNGKAHKFADSSLVAYKTANGRVVYDGKGIKPDIKTEVNEYGDVVVALATGNHMFYYGTKYYYEHDSIVDPKKFSLSDSEYNEFIAWLDKSDFTYDIELETRLDEVLDYLEKDSTVQLNLENEMDAIKSRIDKYKKSDFKKNDKMIKSLLSEEIVSRYYLEEGVIENSFQFDTDIKEAVRILNDSSQYNQILARGE